MAPSTHDRDATHKAEGDAAADLVRRVRDGESAAESEIVERYGPGLRLLLRRLGASPSEVDDLYQETFALGLQKIRAGEVREPAALVGFLRSTARNLFLASRRKGGRTVDLDEGKVPLESRGGAFASEADQLGRVLRNEEARLTRQLLGEMRFERDREVLVRFYLGEEPSDVICRDLDVDPSLFNRVLYRARQRLKELFESSAKARRLTSELNALTSESEKHRDMASARSTR